MESKSPPKDQDFHVVLCTKQPTNKEQPTKTSGSLGHVPLVSPSRLPFGLVSTFKESLQHFFARVNLPPVGSSANLFPWICWGLWINCNLHTFENKQTSPPEILSRAIALLREWEAAQPSSNDRSRTLSPQLSTQISSPSTIFCNTDAAWNKDTIESGLAWIFTSPTGQEITRGCSHQLHVSSPLMVEALAIRRL
ncbi:hypothetical protein IGI04_039355 [Brassica rapa subsp. trilocularis]|uniref:Uncharacterized protein n=1 Tax=Brassica rapa subsp. trilocularis TaxID=1813537 RepID=A0ABQ7KND0_BRACM|nr:hypothetical protein IGI04_039355 [Brassica rapa subsp. trilocularis]